MWLCWYYGEGSRDCNILKSGCDTFFRHLFIDLHPSADGKIMVICNSFFGLGRNYCPWIDMLSEGKVYYYALVRRDHHVPSIYC